MTNEVLRHKLITRIDALLARIFLVTGDDRKLLSAVRGYAVDMTDTELDVLQRHMIEHNAEIPDVE